MNRHVSFRTTVNFVPRAFSLAWRGRGKGAPRYNEPRYNEQHLKARQIYSKVCGNKSLYNEPRYDEMLALTN